MSHRWRRALILWGPALGFMVLVFCVSHIRFGSSSLSRVTHSDKIVHATEYAVLCALLFRALRRSGTAWLCHWSPLAAFLIAALYGVTDEWHQSFVGRDANVLDWMADVFGAAFMAVVLAAFRHARADPRSQSRRAGDDDRW
jgi:VanZ family protein